MRFEAILFDFDNTLADRSAAIRRVGEKFWRMEPAAQAKDTLEKAIDLFVEWDGNGRVLPKRLIFESAQQRWGELSRSPIELEEWYAAEYPVSYEPDSRIDSLLSELMSKEIQWGIVTNGPAFQWDKMRHLGFDKLTDAIVVSETFGHKNPNRRSSAKGFAFWASQALPTPCSLGTAQTTTSRERETSACRPHG